MTAMNIMSKDVSGSLEMWRIQTLPLFFGKTVADTCFSVIVGIKINFYPCTPRFTERRGVNKLLTV